MTPSLGNGGKRFFQVANVIFILLGTGMFAYGLYVAEMNSRNGRGYTVPHWIVSDNRASNSRGASSSVNLAVSGACSVLVGLCGFVSSGVRLRFVTLGYVISLTASLVLCLVFMILMLATTEPPRNHLIPAHDIKVKIQTHYGNLNSNESIGITRSINAFQVDHSCCGWSGDKGQNLFANTPWTRQANAKSKTKYAAKIVYPLSCCTQVSEKFDRNLCFRATDDWVARRQGYIYARDCLEVLQLPRALKPVMAVQYVLLIILKALCLLVSVPLLIELFNTCTPPASPAPSPTSAGRRAAAGTAAKAKTQPEQLNLAVQKHH